MMPTAMAVIPIALVAKARLTSGDLEDDARGAFGHSRRRSHSACRRDPAPLTTERRKATASPRRAQVPRKRCPISVVNAATVDLFLFRRQTTSGDTARKTIKTCPACPRYSAGDGLGGT